jgi:hypothetical protein
MVLYCSLYSIVRCAVSKLESEEAFRSVNSADIVCTTGAKLMASKTKTTRGQEKRKQEERVHRDRQVRALINAAKDAYGLSRRDPDLYLFQKLFQLDETLARISNSILGPQEDGDKPNLSPRSYLSSEKDDTSPKTSSMLGSPDSKKQQNQTESHLAQNVTPEGSVFESEEDGWTPVKGKNRCASKAAGNTPDHQTGISNSGRPLTLTELRTNRARKV